MKRTRLINIRKQCGYSQIQMANILHITQAYYCQIENGNKNLYYDLAIKIAAVFGLKPDYIFYPEKKEK